LLTLKFTNRCSGTKFACNNASNSVTQSPPWEMLLKSISYIKSKGDSKKVHEEKNNFRLY